MKQKKTSDSKNKKSKKTEISESNPKWKNLLIIKSAIPIAFFTLLFTISWRMIDEKYEKKISLTSLTERDKYQNELKELKNTISSLEKQLIELRKTRDMYKLQKVYWQKKYHELKKEHIKLKKRFSDSTGP